ncbi:hypothetical protein C8J57DRAFT_1131282 [Mycena rebaudengoi]|nr:hypothetical protein C8J57DRAFT_1131282 [Mycena rebaudengoi]
MLALAALQTSVFAIAPGSLFKVDEFAQKAIAASGISTGLGILCDGWFLLQYSRLYGGIFRIRTKDIYDSYLFFSLSARLPVFGAIISLGALVLFIARIAYNTIPGFVLAMTTIFCVVMGLQFIMRAAEILYCGIHLCGTCVVSSVGVKSSLREEGETNRGTILSGQSIA